MAKIKHYLPEEDAEDPISIIALNSPCEAYLLAYLINSHCNTCFSRSQKEILFQEGVFECFEWHDEYKGVKMWLISNRCTLTQLQKQKQYSLFDLPETKELYLMQDLKDVDYIIKIESGVEEKRLLEQIETIGEIGYSYLPDPNRLKDISRLNFD
ncbi:MAG: IPExxxVDY family protein [Flavobacteriia bacterium]|nr:IPExxxVDY family protein [Flavobacteriia bacterium]